MRQTQNSFCLSEFSELARFPNMKHFLIFTTLSTIFATTLFAGHPEKNAEDFVQVYDGKNLDGIETEGNWQIQDDGSLYLEPREGETGWSRYNHYIWLKEKYGDFVFDFEYKHGKDGNSGLYFRCADKVDPTKSGFEVQIKDSLGLEDEKMGHHDNGGVIQTKGASKNMSKPANEWNRMTVTMKGSQIQVVLNGELIQDFDLAKEKKDDKELVCRSKSSETTFIVSLKLSIAEAG